LSVSLHPNNRSHSLQHVKYLLNELPLQNELQNFMNNNVLRTKKVKTQQQQNTKKKVGRAGNRTRDLLHLSLLRYLWTTEST